MADVETKSLSENAYQPLKDGEIYMPLVPTSMAPPEVDLARGAVGHVAVYRLQRRVGLFRPQGRPGNGGGDSHLHPRHRLGARLPAALHACWRT